MILKRIITHIAKWDSEKDSWWVGHIEDFSWTDMKDIEVSPRMKFEEALD